MTQLLNTPLSLVDIRGLVPLGDGSYVRSSDLTPEELRAIQQSSELSEAYEGVQLYRDSLREHIARLMESK